jgi:hypothetical protein
MIFLCKVFIFIFSIAHYRREISDNAVQYVKYVNADMTALPNACLVRDSVATLLHSLISRTADYVMYENILWHRLHMTLIGACSIVQDNAQNPINKSITKHRIAKWPRYCNVSSQNVLNQTTHATKRPITSIQSPKMVLFMKLLITKYS